MTTLGSGPQGFSHIAQQLLNKPVAIHPHKMEILMCALQHKLGIVSMETVDGVTLEAKAMIDRAALARDATRDFKSGKTYHVDGDIAVIPVEGTLVHKYGFLDPMSGFCGYDGLSRKLNDAMRDPDILGIWLDIDSPGGAVSGLMAFVEELAMSTQEEGGKPIYAYVNEQATSAAYAIASVCDKIYGPADAMVGSIGAVMVHTSIADALSDNGINVTVIRSGERKMRGNSYENIDKETLSKFQASVDDVRNRFANLVSMGRNIPVAAILATEADWFEGQEAVDRGLMDAIVSEREAFARLEEETDRIKRERRNGQ
jgi:signal peptide peptidase SppA